MSHIVIIGAGPAGMRCAERLGQAGRESIVIGAEPGLPYNRVALSLHLAGDIAEPDLITHDAERLEKLHIRYQSGVMVDCIDRQARSLTLADGSCMPYGTLILALGSQAFRLPLPGATLPGVLMYRTLNEVRCMMQTARAGGRAIVIGGGLLGLEAAVGLAGRGMAVTVLHGVDRLMERQLDTVAGQMLAARLRGQGIAVVLDAKTVAITGRQRATGVLLQDGREIPADLIVMAVGIRPETQLARDAGLKVGRGIIVDDSMVTSDLAILAIGECAEHEGQCCGLVAPAFAQAETAARTVLGETAIYQPRMDATVLKVAGAGVWSAGDIAAEGAEALVYDDPEIGEYRKFLLREHRLIGAVLYGQTQDAAWYTKLLGQDVSALRHVLAFGQAMAPVEGEEYPWHDPALTMAERMALAEGKPLKQRLMAAMGQLDCGQCGYRCQTYAEALAEGRESSTSLCVPGEKATQRMLTSLLPKKAPPPAPAAIEPVSQFVHVRQAARLTGPHSGKDVRHVVIDLSGTDLSYQPGDSIALRVLNDPERVQACLTALRAQDDEMVPCPDGVIRPVREAFAAHLDIARPLDRTTHLLSNVASHPNDAAGLRRLYDGKDGAKPEKADLLDLLQAFPSARPPLVDLACSLPRLKPRHYSIASSPRVAPGQAHLCVSVVSDTRAGRVRHGVASSFLAERAMAHGPIMARIVTSHFRLPRDPATPVIMVGPGTGIAPFRGFLQERAALRQPGPCWLFFGDQRQDSDFLFERELRSWLADGTLTRLDTAFSRDQAEKIYVQDRMRAAGAEMWRWLQEGAYFYVCGDASRMARDVNSALRGIAMSHGRLGEARATDWITALARQGRYLRDVY